MKASKQLHTNNPKICVKFNVVLSVLWSDTLFWKQQNNSGNKLCFVLCIYLLQQLVEKRKEKRAAELVKQDDEVIVKLEDSAIEHSKSVDSAVLGKYNIWRKENENENADSTVRLIRDQIIMAKVYLSIAKMKNKLQLYQELESQLKESQRALGEATSDADMRHRYESYEQFSLK